MTTAWCVQPECGYGQAHAHCPSCGVVSVGPELCPHHACVYGDDWAVANRMICDGVHRKRWPARLPEAERLEPPPAGDYGEIG